MAVHFKVADLQREITAFRTVSRKYLPASSDRSLQQAADDLTNLALRTSSHSIPWTVNPNSPITTNVSKGDFMRGSKGGLHVFAEISFIWDLIPIRSQPGKRGSAAPIVSLDGRASTVIKIFETPADDSSDPQEIAMWRMEVADSAAPGTYFHVQVMGTLEDPPFPKAFDVPRLPSVLVSPFACIEFVIGELFQDDWKRESSKATPPMNQWRGIQADRSSKQLLWHLQTLDRTSGSPWSAMKQAKPPVDLFL